MSKDQFLNDITAAAKQHGIRPELLSALIQAESSFNPTAVSPAGAMGLLQIMPRTAEELGIDPMDPKQAIEGGARYLSKMLKRFGSEELALAAYNAGPGNVRKHGGIPPFPETQAYIPKVLGLAGPPPPPPMMGPPAPPPAPPAAVPSTMQPPPQNRFDFASLLKEMPTTPWTAPLLLAFALQRRRQKGRQDQ